MRSRSALRLWRKNSFGCRVCRAPLHSPPQPLCSLVANPTLGHGLADHAAPLSLPLPRSAVVRVPLILTAADGFSSRTYTLSFYGHASPPPAQLRLPDSAVAGIAPSDGASGGAYPGSGTISGGGAGATNVQAAFDAWFAARPADWPAPPLSNCSVCGPGSYSPAAGAVSCQYCPPGKYAPAPLASGCSACPAGTYAFAWGAANCRCGPRRGLPVTFAVSVCAVAAVRKHARTLDSLACAVPAHHFASC